MQGSTGYIHEAPIICHDCGAPTDAHLETCKERVVEFDGLALHVTKDFGGDWTVWLNTEVAPDGADGLCLSSMPEREDAIGRACSSLALGMRLLIADLTGDLAEIEKQIEKQISDSQKEH